MLAKGDFVEAFKEEDKPWGQVIDFSPARKYIEIEFCGPKRMRGKKELRHIHDVLKRPTGIVLNEIVTGVRRCI